MKKLLLLISVMTFGMTEVGAQCTPDPQFTSPGIYPDSATGFSNGCEGVYYEQLITNVVPQDTCVEVIQGLPCTTFAFDSIVIVSFTGLPSSLSYACSSTLGGCSFAGGESGCVIITGTPGAADVGTHNLQIVVDAYLGGVSTSMSTQTVDWYSITIESAAACAAAGIETNQQETLRLYPNPAETSVTLTGIPTDVEKVTIVTMNGQTLLEQSDISGSTLELNVETLEDGVYFVHVQSATSPSTIRFIKK